MFTESLIYVLLLALKLTENKEEKCMMPDSKKSLFYSKDKDNATWSIFTNFNAFDELILDCNQTYNITQYVSIWPKKQITIDRQFQFNKIFNQNQINSIAYLDLNHLKGIDLNSESFILKTNPFRQRTFLNIFFSRLNVYSSSKLIESENCNLATYNLSSNFAKHVFGMTIYSVYYPSKWCPYFFRDFDLVYLFFSDIINSFLIRNRLNFFYLNSSEIYLRKIISLKIDLTYESLNRNNLTPELFRKIQQLK